MIISTFILYLLSSRCRYWRWDERLFFSVVRLPPWNKLVGQRSNKNWFASSTLEESCKRPLELELLLFSCLCPFWWFLCSYTGGRQPAVRPCSDDLHLYWASLTLGYDSLLLSEWPGLLGREGIVWSQGGEWLTSRRAPWILMSLVYKRRKTLSCNLWICILFRALGWTEKAKWP